MSARIQLRRGTAAQWTTANPILASGEIGLETDTLAIKFGNGSSVWSALPYREFGGEFLNFLFNAYASGVEPSNPAAGKMLLYAKNVAGRMMPKFKGPSGFDTPLQPSIFSNGMEFILPSSGTAFSVLGTSTFTAVGTVSHPVLASGNLRLSTRRAIVTSAAVANSASELRVALTRCWRGDAAGLGGFFTTFRFGCSSAVAGQRLIVGLTNSTAAIAVTQSPSALTNCVFLGNDAGDANLQIMHNDGAGTCTKIDLGASFPVPSSVNNAIYELVLFAKSNDLSIFYRVQRIDTGAVVSGEINSADIPASTTFLVPHLYANNNAVASAAILDFYRYYLESDT